MHAPGTAAEPIPQNHNDIQEDDERDYWSLLNEDQYDPHDFFVEEEEIPIDIEEF